MGTTDPIVTNSDYYHLLWENDFVRVLEYKDAPGARTTPHEHPNSVMITLSAFQRRLVAGDRTLDVALEAGEAVWLPAQVHRGHNTGSTDTHTIFVELKGTAAGEPSQPELGPAAG